MKQAKRKMGKQAMKTASARTNEGPQGVRTGDIPSMAQWYQEICAPKKGPEKSRLPELRPSWPRRLLGRLSQG